tara:strand:+ start:275 stop:544 length:270 start_codon:yes stop_codon:yes gene_type:complete
MKLDSLVKVNLCETICKKAFQISGWLILGTATGSSDQDICRISLEHAGFLCIPKAWKLCKDIWEAEKLVGNSAFPVTIEEVIYHYGDFC